MKALATVALGALALACALPSQAAAATINFDDGTPYTYVDSFYAAQGVTFSNALFTPNFNYLGSSGTLGIMSANQSYFPNLQTAIVAIFANLQSSVSIRAIDVGFSGARIVAYDTNGAQLGMAERFGEGAGTNNFVDLTVNAAGIKSVKLYQPLASGGDGTLFENFAFSGQAGVPEPAAWAMMIGGFGVAGAMIRRRRAAQRTT